MEFLVLRRPGCLQRAGKLGTMRAGNNGKSNPVGWSLQRDSNANPNIGSWGGPFPVALMGMGDGSVRSVAYTTPNFGAFLTPSGGEVVAFLEAEGGLSLRP